MTVEDLFMLWAGEPCQHKRLLPVSGSNRRYYRMSSAGHSCIATEGDEVRENEAFIAMAHHFGAKGLPVPAVYGVADDCRCYLQQDLGDRTLYTYLYDRRRLGQSNDAESLHLYQQALHRLVDFQREGADFDFSLCYPRNAFDRQSMQWDLNYFKYFYLKVAHIPFDEQLLEDDFQHLMDYLLEADSTYFMYRDFQTRNIMMADDGAFSFIDFQGGRRGPLQYDVASLLYSSKSTLPYAVRDDLLRYYISIARPLIERQDGTTQAFTRRYYVVVLLRIMQALGACGYRGYCEHKDSFLKSLPQAVANLRSVIENHEVGVSLPHLMKVLHSVVEKVPATPSAGATVPTDSLVVEVYSFSYRNAIPADPTGNGGGFVFDCRALPNPGRYEQYRSMTGMDAEVIAFMRQHDEVERFLATAQQVVFPSVERYMERHFSHLMVSFGCTGGQHRSVYCAEQMAARLSKAYPCKVVLHHVQQEVSRQL